MDFADVLRARRMVRSYRPDPVPEDVVRRIVQVVHRAPSAGFSQGHRLIVVTDPEIRGKVAELIEPPYLESGVGPWVSVAPVLIVIGVREASYHERYQQPDKVTEDGEEGQWPVPYWWFDSGSLLVMLQMAAANEGLATGFFGPHADGLEEVVGLPADVGLAGIMTLGYSDDNDRRVPAKLTNRPKRIPLDDLVTWR
ncbi:nitroreductase family protein [Kutzneria sp. CA-103260]|uniref:nitroreductase family protein n=1 Tax=Kutzneria sp. CA-103260 TaxID=2802641 RepID=UPI001BA9ABCD|nr:nitroreductase family protein [Kutzneria sp. CA-103260]QUQ67592.1 nitroreductase [Kutzneria sp. CA-103260]